MIGLFLRQITTIEMSGVNRQELIQRYESLAIAALNAPVGLKRQQALECLTRVRFVSAERVTLQMLYSDEQLIDQAAQILEE